ncbi:MAG: hypothetical protein LRY28_04040, partial [Erysipelotrichaceae bacterium]|nr:hypothetical protein [Erysipelotrichaceae bacterium]
RPVRHLSLTNLVTADLPACSSPAPLSIQLTCANRIDITSWNQVSPASTLDWPWDNVLNNETAPLGLVGTWMNVEAAKEATGSEYAITRMPTYNGNQLRTFVKTKGFVINAYTEFRSAATELMRLIYSKEGFQAMVDSSTYAPSLVDGSTLVPNLVEGGVQSQFMVGLSVSYPEPALMLPNNPRMKALDAAYYPFMGNLMKAVYDGTLTIEEAVAQIISDSNEKIALDNQAQ